MRRAEENGYLQGLLAFFAVEPSDNRRKVRVSAVQDHLIHLV
jgi:hypothetical protein